MDEAILNLPKSRAEARERGMDRFFTGVPCRHGHIAARYVSTTNCVECQLVHARRNGGWKPRPPQAEYLRIARELVESKGGVLLSTEYVSAKSMLKVRCGVGHEFALTYDNLKHGRWCPACKHENHSARMAAQLRPVEELREFARREHGGDCLATSPVSMNTHVCWKCRKPEHEPFAATVSHVLHQRTWCPECDAERRWLHPPKPPIPRESVEKLVRERGGEIVHLVGPAGWNGLRTRLRIRCADAHEWDVTAGSLVHARSWCPECRNKGERIARAIFEATFGDKFPKSKPDWLASATGRKLELDGYNESLRLAFEYQGPHHFMQDSVKATDALKRAACTDHAVQLVEIEAIKRPFPTEKVLAKVAAAFRSYGLTKTPVLPSIDVFARELEGLQRLAKKKGGTLVSPAYLGSQPHEWLCGNPRHPSWQAEPWRIRNGSWCPSCAGNRRLGVDGLRAWGETIGMVLLSTEYHGTNAVYEWRCKEAGHVIRRSKGNIQQSLTKGLPGCNACGADAPNFMLARKKKADDFALRLLPVIEDIKSEGHTALEAIARQLNQRGIATVRGARWYASTVKNLLDRSAHLR